jgi:hypothetical protein
MKTLKYLLFLILTVLIAGSIYFATKDGSFNVAENKVISAPAQLVYDNVKDFKNWKNWVPWIQIDPNVTISYAEKTEGKGASYSWSSDNIEVGGGYIETIKVIPNKEIEQKFIFNTPLGDSQNDIYWHFEETETPGQTKVTWGMKGEKSFMEKVFISFKKEDMETGISSMFQDGLTNLEGVVLEEMKKFTINVDGITHYEGGYYMYNTTASKQNEIGAKMTPMMGQVSGYMEENKLPISGMPFTIYNKIDKLNGTVIFSACVPVKEKVITPIGSPVFCGFMEPVIALKTTLKGNYDHLPEAYAKAMEYIAINKLEIDPTSKMFEVYSTDPGLVPNPANWVTEIYMPIVPQPNPEN